MGKSLQNILLLICISPKRSRVAWRGFKNWSAITRLQNLIRVSKKKPWSMRQCNVGGVESLYMAASHRKDSICSAAVPRSEGRLRSEVYAPGMGKVERDVYNTWLKQPWLRDFHACLHTAEASHLIFNHDLVLKAVEGEKMTMKPWLKQSDYYTLLLNHILLFIQKSIDCIFS